MISFFSSSRTDMVGLTSRLALTQLNLRSPHRNSTFQKLFGLPPEEFLISDFTCQLKRKLPLQVLAIK